MDEGSGDHGRVRVLLVDDDALVRQGLRLILREADGVEVVGECADGDQVVPAVHAHRPDVVVMDLQMRRMGGLEATGAVLSEPRPPRVLVLTTFDGDDEALAAVRAGAAGFLLKTDGPRDIVAAIRSVAAGDGAVSTRTAGRLFAHLVEDPGGAARREAQARMARLTPRERQVAGEVAQGRSNVEIARRLFVSEGTVKSVLASAQGKLGVGNRVAVAVVADRAR